MRPGKRLAFSRLAHLAAAVFLGCGLWLAALACLTAGPALAAPRAAGTSTVVTYTSSVDGTSLFYQEYLPAGYIPTVAYPVAVMLTSAGGVIYQYDTTPWRDAADAHGYILATVQPRTLPGYPSWRQTFFIDGPLLPGEQDVLDALPVIAARHLINSRRIYLGGYSMGGMGSLKLATTRPGIFAAAAPGAPASDLLQESSYLTLSTAPNLATVLGGNPGQSVLTDTYWLENSPRFLIGNLMHTPLRILHGTLDTLLPNDTSIAPYMQSRHVVDTPGFVDSRGRAVTLDELELLWPGDFLEEHVWPVANHGTASLFYLPQDVLTYFDKYQLVDDPLDAWFTTFDDRHTFAYWLRLDLVHPWTAVPGSVIVSRAPATNTVRVQAQGSLTLTLELPAMGLNTSLPLTAAVQPISAAVASDVALGLSGIWPPAASLSVTRDGIMVPSSAYTVTNGSFILLRQPLTAMHSYVISSTSAALTRVYLPLMQR